MSSTPQLRLTRDELVRLSQVTAGGAEDSWQYNGWRGTAGRLASEALALRDERDQLQLELNIASQNWYDSVQRERHLENLGTKLEAENDALRLALETITKDKGQGYATHDQCQYCGEGLPEHAPDCPTAIARAALCQ